MFDRFANVYARGKYPNLSQEMAAILPDIIKQYNIPLNGSRTLLDVACGEGSFAVEMAKKAGLSQESIFLKRCSVSPNIAPIMRMFR